jgi:hypothetical protein
LPPVRDNREVEIPEEWIKRAEEDRPLGYSLSELMLAQEDIPRGSETLYAVSGKRIPDVPASPEAERVIQEASTWGQVPGGRHYTKEQESEYGVSLPEQAHLLPAAPEGTTPASREYRQWVVGGGLEKFPLAGGDPRNIVSIPSESMREVESNWLPERYQLLGLHSPTLWSEWGEMFDPEVLDIVEEYGIGPTAEKKITEHYVQTRQLSHPDLWSDEDIDRSTQFALDSFRYHIPDKIRERKKNTEVLRELVDRPEKLGGDFSLAERMENQESLWEAEHVPRHELAHGVVTELENLSRPPRARSGDLWHSLNFNMPLIREDNLLRSYDIPPSGDSDATLSSHKSEELLIRLSELRTESPNLTGPDLRKAQRWVSSYILDKVIMPDLMRRRDDASGTDQERIDQLQRAAFNRQEIAPEMIANALLADPEINDQLDYLQDAARKLRQAKGFSESPVFQNGGIVDLLPRGEVNAFYAPETSTPTQTASSAGVSGALNLGDLLQLEGRYNRSDAEHYEANIPENIKQRFGLRNPESRRRGYEGTATVKTSEVLNGIAPDWMTLDDVSVTYGQQHNRFTDRAGGVRKSGTRARGVGAGLSIGDDLRLAAEYMERGLYDDPNRQFSASATHPVGDGRVSGEFRRNINPDPRQEDETYVGGNVTIPFQEGGIASLPKNPVLGGQEHMLAYITPEEASTLRAQGGGVTPDGGQYRGPGGIAAFAPVGLSGTAAARGMGMGVPGIGRGQPSYSRSSSPATELGLPPATSPWSLAQQDAMSDRGLIAKAAAADPQSNQFSGDPTSLINIARKNLTRKQSITPEMHEALDAHNKAIAKKAEAGGRDPYGDLAANIQSTRKALDLTGYVLGTASHINAIDNAINQNPGGFFGDGTLGWDTRGKKTSLGALSNMTTKEANAVLGNPDTSTVLDPNSPFFALLDFGTELLPFPASVVKTAGNFLNRFDDTREPGIVASAADAALDLLGVNDALTWAGNLIPSGEPGAQQQDVNRQGLRDEPDTGTISTGDVTDAFDFLGEQLSLGNIFDQSTPSTETDTRSYQGGPGLVPTPDPMQLQPLGVTPPIPTATETLEDFPAPPDVNAAAQQLADATGATYDQALAYFASRYA